ncbi:MAG: hypothetical protein KDI83_19690, partial [Gammaproteobacteria bacterium]|nr:hypothetical protein [Gammaproteobacteria bacterium]
SGSTDVDGDSLTFFWSLTVPASSAAVLSDATAVMSTFEMDVPGTYLAQLIVNDGTVDSAPDTVTISTEKPAPVADAGEDQSVSVGDTVKLDGSGSTDVDGDSLTFFWSLTPPSGSGAVLSDPTAVMPTFEADVPGTYLAQLIVSDGTVESAPDTVVITAEESAELGYIDTDSYRLISLRRASYPYYNYIYDVVFVNTSGQNINNLVLRVTSGADDPMITDDLVEFGFVPAGGSVRSPDTFSFQHNRRLPLDLSVLNWQVE